MALLVVALFAVVVGGVKPSTRNAARTNALETDERRHTMGGGEGSVRSHVRVGGRSFSVASITRVVVSPQGDRKPNACVPITSKQRRGAEPSCC